jgi:outer membrane protein assembly factor BamB
VSNPQILNAGAVPVTVQSSSDSSSPLSNAIAFTIQPLPPLALNSISPSTVVTGGAGFVVTALGQGFVPNAVIQWNGSALATTYVSESQLQAQIPAANITAAGTAVVTVQNSVATGGTSSALTLKVQAPSPDAVAFQITTGHSGATTFHTLSFPTASTWNVNVGGTPSYALLAEGKVVVTVQVGNGTQLLALDQATGATVWGPIALAGRANAAYDGGKVFVVSGTFGTTALMQSFDLATGRSDWSATLVGQYAFSSGPTALNGFVYTGGAGSGGTLYALNEGSGSIAWTQEVANGDDSTPAVTNEGVYVTYPCSTYAFQPSTGNSLFFNNSGCEGGGGATAVVANNVLYSPDGSGGSYSGTTFNALTGALLGSFVADVPPAFGTQMGFFLQSGTLTGITLSNNTIAWSFTGDGSLVTSPILINQTVIVGSSTGNVYAVNAATGQQVWTINAGGAIPAGAHWGASMPLSALAAGDGLLIVPAGNQVVAYTLSTNP